LSIHLYMSIFTDRNALWHKKKLSLICAVNCLNRRTDLNRLLISYRKLLRCSVKIWELYECCNMSRSAWTLWNIVPWWVPFCFILNYDSWQIKATIKIHFTDVYLLMWIALGIRNKSRPVNQTLVSARTDLDSVNENPRIRKISSESKSHLCHP